MIVLPALEIDLLALVDLVNAAYRGAGSRKGWTTEEELVGGQRIDLAMLRADIASPGCIILTVRAQDGGPIQGCVKLEALEGGACELGMLSVAPEVQANGIGKQLLAASEIFARERGMDRLRITVIHMRDTLIAWYERHGFGRTGETKPFPYGDTRIGVPRRDDLYFVVLEKPL